jgi:hypothetical protein
MGLSRVARGRFAGVHDAKLAIDDPECFLATFEA